jgi:hypothetical protein
MFDFNDALQRGLDAAKRAQANRDEIRGVFTQLNEALHSMSRGKVEIAIVPIEDTLNELARLAIFMDTSKSEQVLAVRVVGQGAFRPKRIARWSQGDAGYPCTIMWEERHTSCDSADSLRSELAELVSSPSVGEAICSAMEFQPIVAQP